VVANAGDIDSDTTIIGGSGTDVLKLTADGGTANLTKVSGFESIIVLPNATDPTKTVTITTAEATVAAGKTLTVDASALTNSSATLNFDGSAEDDGGKFNVIGGAGNDTIKGGSGADTLIGGAGNDSIVAGAGNDSIDAGAGNDTIDMAGNLTFADTINGGDGTDTLIVSGNVSSASAFVNVSNVEILKITGNTSVTLDAPIGIHTFDLTDSGDQVLTLASGYTGATTVKLTGDSDNADKIVNNANVDLTVVANAGDIDSDTTIIGGSGTDVLKLTADGDTANLTNVSGFESIIVLPNATDPAKTVAITTADPTVAAGKTLTVDASALTNSSATLNFNGSAESDGKFNVIGGAGADTIKGGSGADTLIGGAGNDSIVAGAGNDSIVAGAGNDIIIGGAGADTLTGGPGNDTFVIANLADSTPTAYDTITDFVPKTATATGDVIQISKSVFFNTQATTVNVYVASNSSLALLALSAAGVPGNNKVNAALDASTGTLYIDGTDGTAAKADGNPDLVIVLTGVTTLTSDAFDLVL
jgi:Ca2+-binding RTX toxin-like protein